jgi:hypothetical protein
MTAAGFFQNRLTPIRLPSAPRWVEHQINDQEDQRLDGNSGETAGLKRVTALDGE